METRHPLLHRLMLKALLLMSRICHFFPFYSYREQMNVDSIPVTQMKLYAQCMAVRDLI